MNAAIFYSTIQFMTISVNELSDPHHYHSAFTPLGSIYGKKPIPDSVVCHICFHPFSNLSSKFLTDKADLQ